MNFKKILVASVLLAGCTGLSGDGDIKSSEYASFGEASEKGAFELGWLPRALPKSATGIVEVHSIDSGEVWARFSYAEDDIQHLTNGCAIDPQVQLPNGERTKRHVGWWPKLLTEGSGQRLGTQWTMFSCPSMQHAGSTYTASVAVSASNRTAWYWITK